jgi:DNA-binding PadR family transcriptional regulator
VTHLSSLIPRTHHIQSQYSLKLAERSIDSRRALIPVELIFLIGLGYNTGYTLRKACEDRFGVTVSFGTIYPLLHSLQLEGYLAERTIFSGRTRKKIYSLTRDGHKALDVNAKFLRTFAKALSEKHRTSREN